jgi:hypothetical protein
MTLKQWENDGWLGPHNARRQEVAGLRILLVALSFLARFFPLTALAPVDTLTTALAMMAAPYHEVTVDPAGHRIESSGYFTGLAELGPAGWKFRNAHWSVAAPTSPAP